MNVQIINLTTHSAIPGQDMFEPADKGRIVDLLTFDDPPSMRGIISTIARGIASLASQDPQWQRGSERAAMLDGPPWLMAPLERALRAQGIEPLYSFTHAVRIASWLDDGSVVHHVRTEHVAWIYAENAPGDPDELPTEFYRPW